MGEIHTEALWRGFPKTLVEFEGRFSSEESCRNYLAACRWNGRPTCNKSGRSKEWRIPCGDI